jgi:hypothetical protein
VTSDPAKYRELHEKYMNDAISLLETGDHLQASEKLWGAVAQMVKTVAASRGWRHSSHRDLRGTISRIFDETGDREFLRLFAVAEALHANFYEDYMRPDEVRVQADDARQLIEKLQSFAN